ncbi:MAG: hypothetical protein ACOVRN_00865 [Flavobacterium sp.]
MPEIRKTIVVGFNLHGEIILDKNNNPETMPVPNNYIVKLNVVAPGVPNISTFENYNDLGNITSNLVSKNNWLNDSMISAMLQENYKSKMLQFVTELKEQFIDENKNNVKGVENEYFKRKNNEPFKHEQNFIYNVDSMYKISEFNKGDLITNKLFYKFTQEQLEESGAEEEYNTGFNKIVLYNFADDGVIYDVFTMLGPEYQYITLFQLIELLTGMGVENLILVDLSCAVFSDKLSSRNVRNLRRRINATNTYGGTIKKKNKNIKNKKLMKTKKYRKNRRKLRNRKI